MTTGVITNSFGAGVYLLGALVVGAICGALVYWLMGRWPR